MTALNQRPARPQTRRSRPGYPQAKTLPALALGALCGSGIVACESLAAPTGESPPPYTPSGVAGAGGGGGGDAGGGGAGAGATTVMVGFYAFGDPQDVVGTMQSMTDLASVGANMFHLNHFGATVGDWTSVLDHAQSLNVRCGISPNNGSCFHDGSPAPWTPDLALGESTLAFLGDNPALLTHASYLSTHVLDEPNHADKWVMADQPFPENRQTLEQVYQTAKNIDARIEVAINFGALEHMNTFQPDAQHRIADVAFSIATISKTSRLGGAWLGEEIERAAALKAEDDSLRVFINLATRVIDGVDLPTPEWITSHGLELVDAARAGKIDGFMLGGWNRSSWMTYSVRDYFEEGVHPEIRDAIVAVLDQSN